MKQSGKLLRSASWMGTVAVLGIAGAIVFSSFNSKPPKERIINELVESRAFQKFTENYLAGFYDYGTVFSSPELNRESFLKDLKDCNDDEGRVERVYAHHGLSFETMITAKNSLDNEVYALLNAHPHLKKYNEEEGTAVIMQAMEIGLFSENEDWQIVRNNVNQKVSTKPRLTWAEVWGCLKDAVGLGIAALFSLEQLAGMTASQIIRTVSGFIIKRAGFFGAALMAIEFAGCIWDESKDLP